MDNFAKLDAAERRPFFEETASRRSSTATAMEKDFWVSWTLQHLFLLKDIPELRFKGGTSLSKVFRLIDRFSEDIDISIDRAALGFSGERDLASPKLSTTKRKALDQELREAITKEVQSNILPKLHARFERVLGKQTWTLAPSEEANEEMTLNFHYPPAFNYKDYLRPQIKIEFGRGDQQPSEKASVASFVAEEFPKEFTGKPAAVIVLDCQRTFWEKVTLLHAENHRPDPSKLKPRMSRHWSDVAVMSVSDRFMTEKLSLDLLRTVIRFKQIYFAANWAKYEIAVPGTIRIAPNEQLRKVLRDDYAQIDAPFIDLDTIDLFLLSGKDDAKLRQLDQRPESGRKLRFTNPYDSGVFLYARTDGSAPMVSNIQAYLDLYARGGRDLKQADYLLTNAIEPRWKAA